MAGCVGREIAPHVKKHGGKLIPESMKKDKDGRSNIEGAMVVAASGVQGRTVVIFRNNFIQLNFKAALQKHNTVAVLGLAT